jgi:ParB/RepB/Spo0J family partition protein
MRDEIRGDVPLGKLRECPFNPRKGYDEGALRELAASMTAHGCLQPLVVRPLPATAAFDEAAGGWPDKTAFEIVAGHRRYRAAKLARFKMLPVTVHTGLTDDDVRAIMLVENCNREDLRPSEEAVSLAELVAKIGLEGTAERVGKPESHVRERSALAKLPAWFLAAVDGGLVPGGTAAVVARVPGEESREKAAVCVAAGLHAPHSLRDDWRGEWFDESGEDGPVLADDYSQVLTVREAKELIRTHFCRELKGAPFSRKALELVPEAGSCDDCPKRAGNDPELKAEGVRADTCTDPDCYAAKVEAYRRVEVLKAKSKHGAEAVSPNWMPHLPRPFDWCLLDETVGGSELDDPPGLWKPATANGTVGELLDEVTVARAVTFHPKTGKPVLLVKTADARKALVAAGLMARPEKKPKRVPLGDEEVSLRPAKADDDGPMILYRLTVDLSAVGVIEFAAYADDNPATLRYDALNALEEALDKTPGAFRWEPVPAGEEADLRSRTCRECGCTDLDCTKCIEKTGEPCTWAGEDICSACVAAQDDPPNKKTKPRPGTVGRLDPPPTPLVCAPVGAGKLKDIPGLTAADAACLAAVGLNTLADLERACDAVRAAHSNPDHYPGGIGSQLYEVLRKYPGAFSPGDVTRIGDAVVDHLSAAVRTSALMEPAKGKKKAKPTAKTA